MRLLRPYEPSECGKDGYPLAWHKCPDCNPGDSGCDTCEDGQSIKGLVRVLAGQRCIRCQHPYIVGSRYENGGEWSPCDEFCSHLGPLRGIDLDGPGIFPITDTDLKRDEVNAGEWARLGQIEAQWRILTVHHLTGEKRDCRWWNLAALCQRCHLQIQGRVRMEQVYLHEHSDWFKPYAAGYYAHVYLGEDLTHEETETRLDELLALEGPPPQPKEAAVSGCREKRESNERKTSATSR